MRLCEQQNVAESSKVERSFQYFRSVAVWLIIIYVLLNDF